MALQEVRTAAACDDSRGAGYSACGPDFHPVQPAKGRSARRRGRTPRVVAFSPDGKLVAAGSGPAGASAFEAATGREVFHIGPESAVVAFSHDSKLLATGSRDNTARVFEAATGREVSRLAHQGPVNAVAFSPDATLFVTQTGNWLHLYQRSGDDWRPIANRHFPVIWPNTVRFLPATAHCPRCVEVVRDVPENQIKLDRINFDEYPPLIQGDPRKLVEEWSAKLGLKFDDRGRIVPVQP